MRTPTSISTGNRGGGVAVLATLVLLYVFVSLTPFRDLSDAVPALSADVQSNIVNQLISVLVFAAVMTFGLRREVRPLLARPLLLIAALICWIAVATILGPAGFGGMRRVILSAMVIGIAGALLLMPRDEHQLAGILAFSASAVLGLCYFGVAFLPNLAIHQASDSLEPMLAGDWRGVFSHKNDAGPAMVLLAFVGLFVARVRARAIGWAIFVFAAIFVFQSGGKTAMLLLPATLVVAWLIERGNLFWRTVVVLAVVGGYSGLTIGSTLSPAVAGFVSSLGIDATFTGRTDIWNVAIDGIRAHPLLGYGYGGFWGTEGLVFGFREDTSWAATAPAAHNSYIDMLLMGGVVGLLLSLVWLVALPLRDLSKAIARNGVTPLMRFYIRTWVFGLIAAGMESVILSVASAVWFMLLVAVFGLRLEARAYRREAAAVLPAGALPAT